MKFYRPKWFELYELLPRDFYLGHLPIYGDRLWMAVFDQRILIAADAIRQRYGKMICNTWQFGGQHQYRGYRPPYCSEGEPLSQHRFGRALDLVPVESTAEEVREDIRHNFLKGKDFLDQRNYITRIENRTHWLHIDCANVVSDVIEFFNP